MIHNNYGLSHTISEVKDYVGQKSQIFYTPVYLSSPLTGVPVEYFNGSGKNLRTRMMALPDGRKFLTINAFI